MGKAKYEVTGGFPIVGTDGESVDRGGTVELDDDVTNVGALVQAGLVKPKSGAKAKPEGGDG